MVSWCSKFYVVIYFGLEGCFNLGLRIRGIFLRFEAILGFKKQLLSSKFEVLML